MKRSDYYGIQASIYSVGTILADKPWEVLLALLTVLSACLTLYWTFRE